MDMVTTEARGETSADDGRPSPFALLFAPDRAMDRQARVGRTLRILLFAWVCSMLLATALAVRVSAGSSTLRKLEQSGELKSMSDRQVSDETRKAERVVQVVSIAKGALGPPLWLGLGSLALLGLCWFLRGRVKARAVAPVAAATLLPGAIADLLDAASAFQHAAIPPDGMPLAPRTLSALLLLVGHPISAPWDKLGNALDFYSLWASVMMAFGVAAAGHVPTKRALVGTLIAWLCYRLLTQVAIGG
jgi:hypothetical protein